MLRMRSTRNQIFGISDVVAGMENPALSTLDAPKPFKAVQKQMYQFSQDAVAADDAAHSGFLKHLSTAQQKKKTIQLALRTSPAGVVPNQPASESDSQPNLHAAGTPAAGAVPSAQQAADPAGVAAEGSDPAIPTNAQGADPAAGPTEGKKFKTCVYQIEREMLIMPPRPQSKYKKIKLKLRRVG